MNKIYKIVWSTVKQCYVVASELAKSRTKAPKSNVFSKILVAGLLVTVISCGNVFAASQATPFETLDVGNAQSDNNLYVSGNGTYTYYQFVKGNSGYVTSQLIVRKDVNSGALAYYLTDEVDAGGNPVDVYRSATLNEVQSIYGSDISNRIAAVIGGTSYSAGNGITISSDNKVSVKTGYGIDVGSNGVAVKAGTNVTVNSNGVSVTGNGSVDDGNTGLINGDKLYDEVRSYANGNYVKTTNTTGANLKVLDDKIGAESVANGTYIKTENTVNANLKALDLQIGALNEDGEYIQKNNNVSQNLAALDNAIDDVVNSGLQFGANSGDDVTNKIGSKVSIIGGGTKADNEYDSKNIKTIIVQDENGNTQIEIDLDKNPEFASILTEGDANIGGKLNVDGDTHLKSNLQVDGDTNISGNTTIEKDLTVKGDSNLEGNAHVYQNLQVDGDTNISGNTTIEKNLTVEGDSNLKGDAHIYQNLQVDGDTNLSGNTTIEKDLEVLGNSNIHGNGRYGGDLTVEGDSNLKGNAHVGKNLQVDGDANVSGTLTADKVVTNDIQLPSGSLNRRMDNMDTRIDKVGAGAAALAGLQYAEFDPGSKFSMAMGMGHYKGKTAAAVGGQYHFSRNVSMNLAGTIGNGENMISAGLTFRFGTPRSKYQKDNDALRAENDMLNKRLKAVEKKIQSLSLITEKRAAFPDVEKSHWANKAVETLHGNGFVQGYPDGEFKGDRQMTRYEYAEMLYNALSKGAKVDQAQLEEYAPELHKINAERVRGNKPKNDKKSSQGITTTTVQQDADTQAFGQAYNANHPR